MIESTERDEAMTVGLNSSITLTRGTITVALDAAEKSVLAEARRERDAAQVRYVAAWDAIFTKAARRLGVQIPKVGSFVLPFTDEAV